MPRRERIRGTTTEEKRALVRRLACADTDVVSRLLPGKFVFPSFGTEEHFVPTKNTQLSKSQHALNEGLDARSFINFISAPPSLRNWGGESQTAPVGAQRSSG